MGGLSFLDCDKRWRRLYSFARSAPRRRFQESASRNVHLSRLFPPFHVRSTIVQTVSYPRQTPVKSGYFPPLWFGTGVALIKTGGAKRSPAWPVDDPLLSPKPGDPCDEEDPFRALPAFDQCSIRPVFQQH